LADFGVRAWAAINRQPDMKDIAAGVGRAKGTIDNNSPTAGLAGNQPHSKAGDGYMSREVILLNDGSGWRKQRIIAWTVIDFTGELEFVVSGCLRDKRVSPFASRLRHRRARFVLDERLANRARLLSRERLARTTVD
jgi:hypothetical protein